MLSLVLRKDEASVSAVQVRGRGHLRDLKSNASDAVITKMKSIGRPCVDMAYLEIS